MTTLPLEPAGIEPVVKDAAKRGFTLLVRPNGYRLNNGDIGTEYVLTDVEDPTRVHWRTPSLHSVKAFLRGSHVGYSRGRAERSAEGPGL